MIVTDGVRRRAATTGLSGGLCPAANAWTVGEMGDVGSDSSAAARVREGLLFRRSGWL